MKLVGETSKPIVFLSHVFRMQDTGTQRETLLATSKLLTQNEERRLEILHEIKKIKGAVNRDRVAGAGVDDECEVSGAVDWSVERVLCCKMMRGY